MTVAEFSSSISSPPLAAVDEEERRDEKASLSFYWPLISPPRGASSMDRGQSAMTWGV